MFNSLFLTALVIFLLGLIYKVSNWFVKKIAAPAQTITTPQRVRSAVGGILSVVFSAKLLIVLKVILVDVLLQGRVFREDVSRWLAHMLIFYGFMLLLIMHALDSVVTEALFSDYYATVNPFFFLRDLFGAMVIVGVAMAVFRRYFSKIPRLRTGPRDHYAIVILAVIMFSGIALEGLKITSHSEFMRMVEDYAGLDDEEEINALEAVWVAEYGTVSPNITAPFDEELLATGLEVHEGRLSALVLEEGRLPCEAAVMAPGNSSRDLFEGLHAAGVPLSPKSFAVGVRIDEVPITPDKVRRALDDKARGGAGRVGPSSFPQIDWPEALVVPPPWEGGDGNATNDPTRKRAAKLDEVPRP